MGIGARTVAQSEKSTAFSETGSGATITPLHQDSKFRRQKSLKKDGEGSAALHETPPTVGTLLTQRRESLGKSLPEIAKALRIAERYLRALEEDKGRDLPERVYAVGFFRTYSRFLGFEGPEMVNRFCEEVLEAPRQKDYHLPISYAPGTAPSNKTLKISLFLVGILSLGWITYDKWAPTSFPGQGFFAFWQKEGADNALVPPTAVPEILPQGAEAKDKTTPASERISVSIPEHEVLQDDDTPQIEEEVEAYAQQLRAQRGVNSTAPSPSDSPASDSAKSGADPASEVALRAVSPISSVPAESSAEGNLSPKAPYFLEFQEKSWVEIRRLSDGKVILQKTFLAGERQAVPRESGLVLRVGNAGGVRLTQGQKRGTLLGGAGQVLSNISLDPDTLRSYF